MDERQLRSVTAQWGTPIGVLLLLGTAAPWMVEANQQHAQTQAQQTEAQQAQRRIDQGCQRLYAGGNEVLLSPELTPQDPVTRQHLAPGTRVCDRAGNTAIIAADGALTEFKWAAPSPTPAPTATPQGLTP
jgi:hypothetical protein